MTDPDLGGLTPREHDVVMAAAQGGQAKVIAQSLHLSPRTVEHQLSGAYRKLGVSNRANLVALLRDVPEQLAPVTRYAVSGDSHIAFQVVGEGPRDLLLVPGVISNVETGWMWPAHASFLHRLASGRRLILFDKRGTGLSVPVVDPSRLTLEERVDELRAVMDGAGSRRATLFGFSEGAALTMLFAATYPSRVNGLVFYGALISGALNPDAAGSADVFADPTAAWELIKSAWGTGEFLAPFADDLLAESELTHLARFERHGASPSAALAIIRMARSVEARGLCPAVRAPALVLHRRDDNLVPVANSRYLAEHLPDARYVELEGRGDVAWLGERERFFQELERFLAADHPTGTGPTRLLQALLMVDSSLRPTLLAVVERFHGRPATSSRGLVYAFDGAVRAVECALALEEMDRSLLLVVHAGEVRMSAGGMEGGAVDVAAALTASRTELGAPVSGLAPSTAADRTRAL